MFHEDLFKTMVKDFILATVYRVKIKQLSLRAGWVSKRYVWVSEMMRQSEPTDISEQAYRYDWASTRIWLNKHTDTTE